MLPFRTDKDIFFLALILLDSHGFCISWYLLVIHFPFHNEPMVGKKTQLCIKNTLMAPSFLFLLFWLCVTHANFVNGKQVSALQLNLQTISYTLWISKGN